LGDDALSGLFVGWGRVYQHYWCVAKFIGEPPLQILVIHNAKALILWRELSPLHNLCHLDEKIIPQQHCHQIPSQLFLLVMKDNLMICFVSKWVASKSSVKATISRSLIVFIIFTSLFDLAGGGFIKISPGGRNRVFTEIRHPGL